MENTQGEPRQFKTAGQINKSKITEAAEKLMTFPDGHTMPFADIIGDLFRMAPPFFEADPPKTLPLSRSEVRRQKEIWLEPISPDSDLRNELRGWYHVKSRFVENEYGIRFYPDTYDSKWPAFLSYSRL